MDGNQPAKSAGHSVLFVCTANMCRSPMAMGLLQARVGLNNPDWRIESAGTWAFENEPAAANTIAVLLGRGLDLRQHAARTVDRQIVNAFKLILTMERGQKEAMRIEFPGSAGNIYLLSEMIGQVYDIYDPMGSSLGAFMETAREIDEILDKGFDEIARLSVDDRQ